MKTLINLIPIAIIIYFILIMIFIIPQIFKNQNLNTSNKYLWMFAVIGFPILGPLAYKIMNQK